MQRYFIQSEQLTDQTVTLTGEDARHLTRVLRATEGYSFIASDGVQRDVLAQVQRIEKDQVIARIVEQLPRENEPDIEVVIAQSLPKGDKLEWVIQKCTEIGAAAFYPFTSARTVVQFDQKKEGRKLERWNKIAKEAAEQSGRNRIPEVHAPVTMKQLLGDCPSFDQVYICYEKGLDQGMKPLLVQLKEKFSAEGADRNLKLLVIVGPEGGFTPEEVAAAEAAGAVTIGLGKRILRTETAPIVALSCILYEFDQMGGSLDANDA